MSYRYSSSTRLTPRRAMQALALSFVSITALAQNGGAPWSVGPVNISGLVDGYYNYTPNHPASRNILYRNFDVKANAFSLNMAKVDLDLNADPVGFKLSLGVGRAWDLFNFADTANGFDNLRYVPQAYITYKPKGLGGVATFDFGKFYTSAGAELTENNLTWNYSRALMYANGPYYHFGLRTTFQVAPTFAAGFQLVNGWNNVEDNNSGKTVGITTAWTPSPKFSWFNSYYAGPETSAFNSGFRNFNSTVVNLAPTSKLAAYGQFDYGTEKALIGGSFDWQAFGGAVRYQVSDKFALSARGERYYDKDGFISGTAQKIKEVTATAEYKFIDNFFTRLEYRRDWSDVAVFERGATLNASKNQDTFVIGMVLFFPPPKPATP